MANEPERPIEKLLRAAAKQRRDEAGAPLELHPATRRLLQGEVARTFARTKGEPRSLSRVLGQLWPGFAWGAALCAVLAVAGYLLWLIPGKGRPEALLARNQSISQAMRANEPLPSPSANQAPAPALSPPATAANPPAVIVAAPPPPTLAQPARPLDVERPQLSKDALVAQSDKKAEEKLASPGAPQLADRKKTAESEVAASGEAPPQAPAGTVNGAYQRRLGLADQVAPATSAPAAPAAPAPAAAPTPAASDLLADQATNPAGAKAEQSGFAFKSLALAASANRPQPAPALTDGGLQFAAQPRDESKGSRVVQWFRQAPPALKAKAGRAAKATSAHPVLASFQVEQAGPELRIIDGDGSVYSGYVQLADAVRRQRSATTAAPALAPAPQALSGAVEGKPAAQQEAAQAAPPTYFFRVAGTNRSLNQQVVFTGSLMAATNLALSRSVTNHLRFGGGIGGGLNGSAQPNLLPLVNSRITGKVVVGGGKAVEINALPTSP